PGLAVGVAQGEHRGYAQGAVEQREDGPVGPRLQGCGGGGAGGVAVAGHAGEEFLGEGEDVAVPEAGGGPVGDAVGLQAGGDLQRVHGAFAELAVAVQEGLHGVGGAARPGGGPRGHPLPAARAGTTCATGPAGTAGATCIAGPAGTVVGGARGVGAAEAVGLLRLSRVTGFPEVSQAAHRTASVAVARAAAGRAHVGVARPAGQVRGTCASAGTANGRRPAVSSRLGRGGGVRATVSRYRPLKAGMFCSTVNSSSARARAAAPRRSRRAGSRSRETH